MNARKALLIAIVDGQQIELKIFGPTNRRNDLADEKSGLIRFGPVAKV